MSPPAADRLRVELGPRSYDIVVGEGLLAEAGHHLAPLLAGSGAVVVSDDNVAPLYLGEVEASLDAAGVEHASIVLPAGEPTKDFDHLRVLTDKLLEARIERSSLVVALGGGVVGDIAGFAAAITLRGLPLVHLPTTLLAQVDSAVGGKTGINVRAGKNLIGAFHQPRLVLSDISTLDTLTPRDLVAGYGEVVKYGLIGDGDFFAWLEANGAALCGGDTAARRHAVLTSCAAKAAIVAADERESGVRALLNLGHTFGHALEARSGYCEALLHGEAVAIGMVLAFELSARMGLCPGGDGHRVRRHLAAIGLPVALAEIADSSWTVESLIDLMGADKKVRGGKSTFVLARGIGKAFVCRDVALDDVRALLDDALGEQEENGG